MGVLTGGKSSSGAPPAPPPAKETAAAQTATNIGTAIAQQYLNNVNQVTPNGKLSYDKTGSHAYIDPATGQSYQIPTFTVTRSLSPEQQRIHSQNVKAQGNLAQLGADQSGRLNSLLSKPIDTGNLPNGGNVSDIRQTNLQRVGEGPSLQTNIADSGDVTRTYGTDFSENRKRVEDTLIARLNPQLQKDKDRLENRLASQGIQIGSEAYRSAMDDYSRQSNDARMSAILGAGQEQSRLAGLESERARFQNSAQAQAFNQASERAGFGNAAKQQMHQNRVQGIGLGNQATIQEANSDIARFNAMNNKRSQAMQETFALRNQPINEITALLSGGQVSQPNFVTPKAAQLATTDFAGIQMGHNNALANRYSQKLAKRGQDMALLGSLISGGSKAATAGM